MSMASPSVGLAPFFVHDHRSCDALWADTEAAAQDGDAQPASDAWQRFDAALRRHLAMEEDVLFPAFEAATGMTSGPTRMMRLEHTQMRCVLDQMAAAARQGEWQDLCDQGDTLMMLIGQHNAKEEGMLYPMAQAHLGAQWPGLAAQLQAYATT